MPPTTRPTRHPASEPPPDSPSAAVKPLLKLDLCDGGWRATLKTDPNLTERGAQGRSPEEAVGRLVLLCPQAFHPDLMIMFIRWQHVGAAESPIDEHYKDG